MLSIILGIFIVIAGFMLTWKSEWLLKNFGRVRWAEKHLALEGGTRLFYKSIGIIIIILGFSVMTGLWTDILTWLTKWFAGP